MPAIMGRKRRSKPTAWAKRIIALQERLGVDDEGLANKLSLLMPGYDITSRAVKAWRLNQRAPSGAWPLLIPRLEK